MNYILLIAAFLLPSFVSASEWSVPFYETISKTPDSRNLMLTINWIIQAVSYLVFVYLVLITGRQLSNENYVDGLFTFIAAVIAGTAPYLARSLI